MSVKKANKDDIAIETRHTPDSCALSALQGPLQAWSCELQVYFDLVEQYLHLIQPALGTACHSL